jgi:hypothetical protein
VERDSGVRDVQDGYEGRWEGIGGYADDRARLFIDILRCACVAHVVVDHVVVLGLLDLVKTAFSVVHIKVPS